MVGGDPSPRCFAHLLVSAAARVLRPFGARMSTVGPHTVTDDEAGLQPQARGRLRSRSGSTAGGDLYRTAAAAGRGPGWPGNFFPGLVGPGPPPRPPPPAPPRPSPPRRPPPRAPPRHS